MYIHLAIVYKPIYTLCTDRRRRKTKRNAEYMSLCRVFSFLIISRNDHNSNSSKATVIVSVSLAFGTLLNYDTFECYHRIDDDNNKVSTQCFAVNAK